VLYWTLAQALAAGTTPDDRVEVWSDTGLMTGQVGLAFGFGAGLHQGGFSLLGTAGVGGRGNLFKTGVSQRPGFGIASLAAGWDLDASGALALVAIVDAALLDNIEQDCGRPTRKDCRHYLFLGSEADPELGLSLQPAVGLRLGGHGSSGAAFSATLGVQPHWLYDQHFWFAPRIDLAIGEGQWSAHAWAGRYGMAVGMGHRLSRPRRKTETVEGAPP
jgi:hypothetical protein